MKLCTNNAPINVKPQGGGARANHGSLIVRSVHRVGILIVCDVPRLTILMVQRTFYHLHLPLGGDFDQLFCPGGGEFEFFLIKMFFFFYHEPLSLISCGDN